MECSAAEESEAVADLRGLKKTGSTPIELTLGGESYTVSHQCGQGAYATVYQVGRTLLPVCSAEGCLRIPISGEGSCQFDFMMWGKMLCCASLNRLLCAGDNCRWQTCCSEAGGPPLSLGVVSLPKSLHSITAWHLGAVGI